MSLYTVLLTSSNRCLLGRYVSKQIKYTNESSENIQKKESGPDRSVSDNQSSLVALNWQ